MDTIVVLKFGGSSVSDNVKLNLVADKIIQFKEENVKVVVVVSAQGKTTDMLYKEAKELSAIPEERELDVLLSTGEQITISKLAILLNRMGHKTVSLTGWQAGIYTNTIHQSSQVNCINTKRIEEELEKNHIVVVAGFQGIDENGDITTLGRGGSDTTAVALAAALNAKHCYIFSDVDGVYTTDPNKVTIAKKIQELSYTEMRDIADAGAKVLHNRCIEIGEKFNTPIIAKSTFNDKEGTTICKKIEGTEIKGIIKDDNLVLITLASPENNSTLFHLFYQDLLKNHIPVEEAINKSNGSFKAEFIIPKGSLSKVQNLIEIDYSKIKVTYQLVSKITIVGYAIMNEPVILQTTLQEIQKENLEVYKIESSQSKIAILFKQEVGDITLENMHRKLIH